MIYVGKTNKSLVRKMHILFTKVVVKQRYFVEHKSKMIPASKVTDKRVRYWGGFTFDEENQYNYYPISESNSDMRCSDIRGYKIVNWMYDTLEEYFAEEGKAVHFQTGEG